MEIDRQTLKALAADTRLNILKSLGKRRKTPSELSKELNLATSTVVEHLNKLEEADLIKREETGHKWIYYNLTEKGSALVKPKIPMNFIIILGVCILVVFIGLFYYNINQFNFAGALNPSSLTSESQGSGEESRTDISKAEEPSIATTAGVACPNCTDCNKIIMKDNYIVGEEVDASVTFCQNIYTHKLDWELYKYQNGNWSHVTFFNDFDNADCSLNETMCGEYNMASMYINMSCIQKNASQKIDWTWNQNAYGIKEINCLNSESKIVDWGCGYAYPIGEGHYKLEFIYNTECTKGWFNFTKAQHLEREFTIS